MVERLDEIERILSSETEIEPSPEFARRVMNEVQRAAHTPPPIPFPWRRVAAAAALIAIAGSAVAALPEAQGPTQHALDLLGQIDGPLVWSALGSLGLSLSVVLYTLWLAQRAD
jgi:hypothetical protein